MRIDPGNTPVTPLDFYDDPISHSLIGAILWSCVLGLLYYTLRKNRRNAFIAGLIVFSHWILDFLAHRPDLPLSFFGGPYFGLGLWYSLPGTLVAEFLLFAIGIALYVRTTKAKDKVGSIGFWTLAVVLGVMYLANLFGPPPPDVSLIAVAGNASYRGYKLPTAQANTQTASCSVSVEDDAVTIHGQSALYPSAAIDVKVDSKGRLVSWTFLGKLQ